MTEEDIDEEIRRRFYPESPEGETTDPGQLDQEIMKNGWLNVTPDEGLVFGPDLAGKWEQAMDKIGIDPGMLSDTAGHA